MVAWKNFIKPAFYFGPLAGAFASMIFSVAVMVGVFGMSGDIVTTISMWVFGGVYIPSQAILFFVPLEEKD